MKSRRLFLLFCASVGIALGVSPIHPVRASESTSTDELRMVVVLSRHGVRSPTSDPQSLDVYSQKPWPQWSVPPGYLTPHGKKLMNIMGGWYRAYYSQFGIVPAQGCAAAGSITVIADDEERTLESAHGLIDGFLPGCDVSVSKAPKAGAGALFSHGLDGASDADRKAALAAVLQRVDGDPQTLVQTHDAALTMMQSILLGCGSEPCSAAQKQGKKVLLEQESKVSPGKGDALVTIKSPLHNASTFAENFSLEYTEGMPMSQVAWGHVSAKQVGELLQLHTDYSDVALRTAPIARIYAGGLANGILATLQQAGDDRVVDHAVGGPGQRFVFLVGHDTNITTLAGMLGLHWKINEAPIDPTSPGGALVFELHRNRTTRAQTVRAYYVTQTMDQMRETVQLDLHVQPQRVPVAIPGCGGGMDDCSLRQFGDLVAQASATP